MKNEIIIYRTEDLSTKIEVNLADETVWLNRAQMSELFGRDIKTIGKHINNALNEELADVSVVANFATTAKDGKTYQVEHYNLDVIISVGYRVKSKRGVQFRKWSNGILKDYLLKGYALNNRMNRLEDNMQSLSDKVNQIDLQIKTELPPKQGVFFDGQIFDAYIFVCQLVKQASKTIILIDNYVDETVLTLLSKRNKNVNARIYTNISKQLRLDIKKHNQQYPEIELKQLTKSHDRFLIIDQKEVYHFGASLKDLGKKWFAFTKIEGLASEILNKLKGDAPSGALSEVEIKGNALNLSKGGEDEE